jgi:transcriptional regulator with XRE-family HTH domain
MTKQTESAGERRAGKAGAAAKTRKPNFADIQIGESIRAHRLVQGMSQSDLARQLGVSFQQVQKYEKGTNRIGAGRLPQIAEIFDIPISALFKGYAAPVPGKGMRAAPVRLITDSTVLKMLTAYADIRDRAIRGCLSDLVALIAKSAKKQGRR